MLLTSWPLFMIIFVAAPQPHVTAQDTEAVQTIAARDIARHISVITHDSIAGRDTPGRGLELTARYIAKHFERFGLRHDSKYSTWFQRFPVPLEVDFAQSSIIFMAAGRQAKAEFVTTAHLGRQVLTPHPGTAPIFLVSGRHPPTSLKDINANGHFVLYVPSSAAQHEEEEEDQIHQLEHLRGSRGLVIVSPESRKVFDLHVQAQYQLPVHRGHRPGAWTAHILAEAIEGLPEILAAAGLDLARLRADTAPVARALPSVRMSFEPRLKKTSADTATAPNVVAILDGSDPRLKSEYVVISAHMDNTGLGQADSVDDNASGVAGLIELAHAFSRANARPRRSIIFLASSGGTKELWGSRFFVSDLMNGPSWIFRRRPRLAVVANINLDFASEISGDSMLIDGLRSLDLEVPPDWIASAHPELRLVVMDGGTGFSTLSDHLAFTSSRLVVPSLSFHTARQRETSATAINADRVARMTRLVFYISQMITNADRRPAWSAEGRRQLAKYNANRKP